MQDSLSISTFATKVELDTVNPIYIYKDTTVASADADMDYGFIEFTSQTLREVLPKPVFEESLLKEKTFVLQKPLTLHEIPPIQDTQTWTFSIVILFFFLLAIGFKFFRNRCLDIIHATLSLKSFEIINKSSNPLILVSAFLFLPIISLLSYSSVAYWFPSEINQFGHIKFYLFSLGAIFIFFVLKMLLIKFFGLLFRCKDQADAYIKNILVFMGFNSILLVLPIFASLFTFDYYKLSLLIVSLSLFALMSIIRTLRGLYIIIKFPKFFHFYLFSYLCTLEILPLLLVYRWIF
jgi:hypothetical protein